MSCAASSRRVRARRRPVAAVVGIALAALVLSPVTAQAAEPTVVSVTVVPSDADLTTGFLDLTLEIGLRSDSALPDELRYPMPEHDDSAWATRVGPSPARTGEALPSGIWWGPLTRVSGSPTDGVWRSVTKVSAYWTGTFRMSRILAGPVDADLTGFDATVTIGPGAAPPLTASPALTGPVKVVTGLEQWSPRLRITDRATGAGVAAFLGGEVSPFVYWSPPPQLPSGAELRRADAAGYVNAPATYVAGNEDIPRFYPVYAGRGSRGYSWETAVRVAPWIKWQANERFTTSGRTVTATGNAWPAPSITRAANGSIRLQHLVGRTWRTVASSYVRSNGRYTITWVAPSAGVQHVRVYKPGGTEGLARSTGTTLPGIAVTLR